MPTAQSIANQCWVDLGVGSPGEIPSASESTNMLAKLNQLIDSYSGSRDMIYEIALARYALTANVGSYAIGLTAGAPFNVARPVKVETASIVLTGIGVSGVTFPIKKIVTEEVWAAIPDRGAAGTVPDTLYVDPSVPNAALNLHPIPICVSATSLELGTWTAVQQFALLTSNLNLPPAYLRMLTLALEIEVGPTYGQVNPVILQQRATQLKEAVAIVRALNSAVEVEPLNSTTNPQQIADIMKQLKG